MKLLKQVISFIVWGCLGFLALLMLATVGTVIVALQRGIGDTELSGLEVKHPERAVGVVELTGEIMSSDRFRRALSKALDNEKLQALVVRIDSPGGAVGASEEMYRAIKQADEKKPVVCSLGNIAASGGLYAAAGCRKIVVNEGTLSGSIGVIFAMPNFRSLIDRAGIGMNVIKSGKFKDTGSPFKDFTEEDRSLLQRLVDRSYRQFVRVIAESRQLEEEAVKAFADGRIILGEEAVELGLADQIGGLRDAATLALKLAKPDLDAEPEIIMPPKPSGIFSLMADLREAKLGQRLRSFSEPQLLYRVPY